MQTLANIGYNFVSFPVGLIYFVIESILLPLGLGLLVLCGIGLFPLYVTLDYILTL